MSTAEMPYTGVATFFKAPLVPRPTAADGDVAVLGVPYDEGTTNRPGARMGPRALREASTNWAYRDGTTAFYDGEADAQLLGGVRWVDCGDVDLAPTLSHERRHAAIAERLQPIVAAGLFPVTLGGDHSIAYATLRAVNQARGGAPFELVQFDTHMDYWDERVANGSRMPARSSAPTRTSSSPTSPSTAYAGYTHRATTSLWHCGAACTSSGANRPKTPWSVSWSSACAPAPTCTSPSTSTPSTRQSRRAPARPARRLYLLRGQGDPAGGGRALAT